MSAAPLPRQYLRLLVSANWRRGAVVLGLDAALAVTEGLGVLLLFPLLHLAGVSSGAGAAGGSRGFPLDGMPLRLPDTLLAALLLYASVMALRAVLQRWSGVAAMQLQEAFLHQLRTRLYRAMLAARWEQVARRRQADLVNALTGDLDRQSDAPGLLLALSSSVLLALVYLGLAIRISVVTTTLALATGALLLFLLRRRRTVARDAANEVDRLNHALFAAAADHVQGIKTTKSYGAEQRSSDLLARLSREVADANVDCERHFGTARALLGFGSVLLMALTVWVARAVVGLDGAALLVLLYLFMRITPQLSAIQSAYQNLVLAMPVFGRIWREIARCEAAAEQSARAVHSHAAADLPLREALTLHDVCYRYPQPVVDPGDGLPPVPGAARPQALNGVTLHIEACTVTAIVGPSGAGKSTIADVLQGLLFPQAGVVTIDGRELTPANVHGWRDQVGYVAQDPFLFHDTIRANLQWAAPGATDRQMRDALALASVGRFVAGLPLGLDTVVGDRGATLSGGERQRIALARALLCQPTLLLLDEATSAVDAEGEQRILEAVDSLRGRMTVVLITHRLASARHADVIHVIDGGRVVERGNWADLTGRGGWFAAACGAQGVATVSPVADVVRAG